MAYLITISKLNNMMRGDGNTSEFEEVLFVNGEHPVADVGSNFQDRRTLVLFFFINSTISPHSIT